MRQNEALRQGVAKALYDCDEDMYNERPPEMSEAEYKAYKRAIGPKLPWEHPDIRRIHSAYLKRADAAIMAGGLTADCDDFDALVRSARAEAARAMSTCPQPDYVISKVATEAGEVVSAAIRCAEGRENRSAVAQEIQQLIAMLYRLWTEGDGVHGLPPVHPAGLEGADG